MMTYKTLQGICKELNIEPLIHNPNIPMSKHIFDNFYIDMINVSRFTNAVKDHNQKCRDYDYNKKFNNIIKE